MPLRTLAGFAITFFVLSSITTIVVGRDDLSQLGAPSLVIPLGSVVARTHSIPRLGRIKKRLPCGRCFRPSCLCVGAC